MVEFFLFGWIHEYWASFNLYIGNKYVVLYFVNMDTLDGKCNCRNIAILEMDLSE